MKKLKNAVHGVVILGLALVMTFGDVRTGFAATTDEPTIRLGNHAPMTRDEFFAWSNQRGIRHINIDGRIYPLIVFFRGNNGRAFDYGVVDNSALPVFPRSGVTSNEVVVPVQNIPAVVQATQEQRIFVPIAVADDTVTAYLNEDTPVLVENASRAGPLDARSAITLPNRGLTASELEAWIAEYDYMGGATAFELAVVDEINRVRVQYGLHPLVIDDALMMSSRLKTQEFGDLQYFSHASPVHGSPTEAAQMFGFDGVVGENISRAGSNTTPLTPRPEDVVGGMLASSRGHREVLLSPDFQSVGFGTFFSPNSRGATGNLTHSFYVATKFGNTQ